MVADHHQRLLEVARACGWTLRFYAAAELAQVMVPNPSETVRKHTGTPSVSEAAALLGLQPADIVKTLVVKRADDSYLFALIPGDLAISWPKLRAVVGVNKLRLPEPELALAATGYERGTIVPIGSEPIGAALPGFTSTLSPARTVSPTARRCGARM